MKPLPFLLMAMAISPFLSAYDVDSLSIEEKVGQLLVVHFNGRAITAEARYLVQELNVGGIITYEWANGNDSPPECRALSVDLQELTSHNKIPIPLIITTDYEGGDVPRFGKRFTLYPGNAALAEANDPELAYQVAFAMGREMAAVGYTHTFAPVVDVAKEKENPIIGIRSFGKTASVVTKFGNEMLRGFHEAGIQTTLKHWPGHGDVKMDSHIGTPVIQKSLEELEKIDLAPFKELANSTETIMTAHIIAEALDPDNCATHSAICNRYLREKIGFTGVIATDSLSMGGALYGCKTVDESVVKALAAGCDLLVLGGKQLQAQSTNELNLDDIKRIHARLVKAVMDDEIPLSRLNDAVSRVLAMKRSSNQEKLQSYLRADLSEVIRTDLNRSLACEVAHRSVKVTGKNKILPDLTDKNVTLLVPLTLKDTFSTIDLSTYSRQLHVDYYSLEFGVTELPEYSDIVVLFTYNAWQHVEEIDLIHRLVKAKRPLIGVVTRDKLDETFFDSNIPRISTLSPTQPSIEAALDLLFQK